MNYNPLKTDTCCLANPDRHLITCPAEIQNSPRHTFQQIAILASYGETIIWAKHEKSLFTILDKLS